MTRDLAKRESVADFTHVLSQMVDVIVVRSKRHETVVEIDKHASCSVINGSQTKPHPCQAIADLYTVRESLAASKGCKLSWVGDGNIVAKSLAVGCAKLGVEFALATPQGYEYGP